jgi:DnaJ-class molecular chaperone
MDHYSLLGVSYDATSSQLSSAYRARSLQLHPDKVAGNAALTDKEKKERTEQFIQLQQAYHVLTHDDSRQQYDAALKGQPRGSSDTMQHHQARTHVE